MEAEASRIEKALRAVLSGGIATSDLVLPGARVVGTSEMGEAIVFELSAGDRA